MIFKDITWLLVQEIRNNQNVKNFWQSLYDSLEKNTIEKKFRENYGQNYYPEQLVRQWSQQQSISLHHARLKVGLFLADKAAQANNTERANIIRERVGIEMAFYKAIERL